MTSLKKKILLLECIFPFVCFLYISLVVYIFKCDNDVLEAHGLKLKISIDAVKIGKLSSYRNRAKAHSSP